MLAACAEAGAAVVPFGGGTSVVGGVAGERGRLRRGGLPRPRAARRRARGRRPSPAARGRRRDAAARSSTTRSAAHGLRLGHYPQSYEWATVGGCAATRSAGQASTGFGRFDDLVAARALRDAGGRARAARRARLAPPGPTCAARARLGGDARRAGRADAAGAPGRPRRRATRRGSCRRSPRAARRCARWRRTGGPGRRAALRRGGDAPDVRPGRIPRVLRASAAATAACSWRAGRGSRARSRRRARRGGAPDRAGCALGRGAGEGWARAPLRRAAPARRPDGPRRARRDARDGDDVGAARGAPRAACRRAARALAATPPLVGCHVSHLYPDGASLYFTVLAAPGPRGPGRAVAPRPSARRATRSRRRGRRSPTTTRSAATTRRGWRPRRGAGLAALRAVKARARPRGDHEPREAAARAQPLPAAAR